MLLLFFLFLWRVYSESDELGVRYMGSGGKRVVRKMGNDSYGRFVVFLESKYYGCEADYRLYSYEITYLYLTNHLIFPAIMFHCG